MSKRIFVLLVALMSVALVGIISVQIFWINNSIEMREQEFSTSVKYALAKVSENIQKREFKDNLTEFAPYLDSVQDLKERGVRDIFFEYFQKPLQEQILYLSKTVLHAFLSKI